MGDGVNIAIRRGVVLRAHLTAIASLFVLHCVVIAALTAGYPQDWHLNLMFNVNGEGNMPELFSTSALLASSAAAYLCYRVEREGGKYARSWLLVSLLLLFMAVDEGAQLHETYGDMLPIAHRGVFLGPWVALYLPLAAVVTVILARFWWRLTSATKILFAAGSVIYVAAAVGMEMVEAQIVDARGEAVFENSWIGMISAVEECGEMLGVALLLQAILAHLALLGRRPVLDVS